MTEFFLATAAIGISITIAMGLALGSARDSLHPTLVLGPMLLFLYVGMPLYIFNGDGFFGYLNEAQLGFAQLVNMVGVVGLLAGLAMGCGKARFQPGPMRTGLDGPSLASAAKVLGILGVVGFAWGIIAVGGVRAAYGVGYGGGWSDSGYVRELYHLTIPAVLMLLLSGEPKRSTSAKVWLVMFAAPLLIHGVLGARRGPLFVVLVTAVAGRYLVRNERPRALAVLGGSALLGVLLLWVVANRNQIYLGSELKLDADPAQYLQAGSSNEFIYGAGSIVAIDATEKFSWGGRYATVLFVRPIPRSIWPTKYQDAAAIFGTNIEQNMGIDVDSLLFVLGWRGAIGAAPGIMADMWIEFRWGVALALFALGFLYGRAWNLTVTRGGLAVVVYGALLCLSLYLVMQTLEAMLFRFLFMVVPSWIVWRRAARPARVRAPKLA